ncbi:MAG TPA: gamma-glutamyl-gamma-aminobutyrate hydrolase family protein [Candidatus Dormibacteraeota bacterium]|nr:gamma-glutamyl-gamma-aminobutyrate hydrolase family protein [Candidatus Dormibacteraeota bacterium]
MDGSRSRATEPVVGILGYLVPDAVSAPGGAEGEEQALFALNYFQKALAFGMLPVAVPALDPFRAPAYLELVDGLIFTGGADIDPELYGQPPHPQLGPTIRKRDEFELQLARSAIARRLPILGICRGMQLLNVAMGGSLEQHLAPGDRWLRHGTGSPDPEFHQIEVVDEELRALLGHRPTVNSLHHQAVLELSPGLRVAARSPDGVIEAVVGVDEPLLAVQWHPEQLHLGHPAGDGPYRWLRSRMAAGR